ncbi:Hypothetical predicted protein [Paramuricea clavata]|uniref:Uncharacterized protein n=1 Tax=Paramuricea clavata TaxID=317549 RepID=A0A6S7FQ09_PARCT|nr:Hypothetical predicted protein [Paramuricea clavata]
MAKRKNPEKSHSDGERKRYKLGDKDLQDIVDMVRVNKTRVEITPKNIADIAKMVHENRLQKQTTKTSRGKRNYNIEDRDLREIANIVEKNKEHTQIPRNAFHVDLLRTHRRLGYNEYIYSVRIGAGNITTLPEFYDSLTEIFSYLINTMNYIASSPTDKARFYISKAPRTPFSTAILNVSDFNTDMFFDIFEKHMQSNAQEVIDGGWSTTVSLYIFPNSYIPRTTKEKTVRKKQMYRSVGKNGTDVGRGRKKLVQKHGREIRSGVFQVVSKSDCCFALALLTGRSFVDKDERYDKLSLNRNTPLEQLYTDDEITDVYEQCGLAVGGVSINQLPDVYERYLAVQNIDLVVFSKNNDDIVYDSRMRGTDEICSTNLKIIFLWLNDRHYDLVLSPNTFLQMTAGKFCFKCMNYLKHWERVTTHVCRISFSCLNCYSGGEKCPEEEGFFIQCPQCFVNFKNHDCYMAHLTKRVFKKGSEKVYSVTPCQHMFFCKTCYKKVPRMTVMGKKTAAHNCDMVYCKHCNAVKKKRTNVL